MTNKDSKKRKLRIVLVFAPTGEFSDYNTPTGLLYIGTVLKKRGNPVKLVDCLVEPEYDKILDSEIRNADILGVYSMSAQIEYLLPLLKRLKEKNPGIKIIWGGPHATLFPEQTAASPLADIVVRGEGEKTMLELVEKYESGKKVDLHTIKGISFKEGDKVFSTGDREFIDLNELPFIDWSLVNKKVMDNIEKGGIIRVQTSRGCPFRCSFCINRVTNNRKMRYRDAKLVLDEIEDLCKKYKIQVIGFRDELFMSNREQLREICQGLIDRNIKIKWLANPRAPYLNESWIDDDLLRLVVNSGCFKLQTGGESGSERVLNLLKKDIKREDIIRFVERCTKFNIIPLVAFMTGLPTETDEEQLETLRLIREITRINPKSISNGPANYRPYPGSELYDLCVKKYDLKMPQSLEGWAETEMLGGDRPPWIKKIYLNQFLWTSVLVAKTDFGGMMRHVKRKPLEGLGVLLFYVPFKLRFRYTFYKFPIEFLLLYWFHKYILKRSPMLS